MFKYISNKFYCASELTINHLPPELFQSIIGFVMTFTTLQSIIRLRSVSKCWFENINGYLQTHNSATFSSQDLEHLPPYNFVQTFPLINYKSLDYMLSLTPRLTSMKFERLQADNNIGDVFKKHQLNLSLFSLNNVRGIGSLGYSLIASNLVNLKQLSIINCTISDKSLSFLLQMLSKLESFKFKPLFYDQNNGYYLKYFGSQINLIDLDLSLHYNPNPALEALSSGNGKYAKTLKLKIENIDSGNMFTLKNMKFSSLTLIFGTEFEVSFDFLVLFKQLTLLTLKEICHFEEIRSITDESMSVLKNLPNLKSLSLGSKSYSLLISKESIKTIVNYMNSLETLYLNNAINIYDDSIILLSSHKMLNKMFLIGCYNLKNEVLKNVIINSNKSMSITLKFCHILKHTMLDGASEAALNSNFVFNVFIHQFVYPKHFVCPKNLNINYIEL